MELRYVKGLRLDIADALVFSKRKGGPFRSTEDISQRLPILNRKELNQLARIGALNGIEGLNIVVMLSGRLSR